MAIPSSKQAWRTRLEASFNAISPIASFDVGDWSEGSVNGWHDVAGTQDNEGFQPVTTVIYPSVANGQPFMNTALPVAGSFPAELVSGFEMAVYPELLDPWMVHIFGQVTRVETAGVAAAAIGDFTALVALDTQPAGTEQLRFDCTVVTTTAAATIAIIQNAVTVETITIAEGLAANFSVYTKDGYDGSVDAITFLTAGDIGIGGQVVVSGIQFVTSTYSFPVSPDSVPLTMIFQEIGRAEAGSGGGFGAEFYPGCIVPTFDMAFDRTANDNLLMASSSVNGIQDPTNPNDAIPFEGDPAKFYRPIVGWNGVFKINEGAGLVNFCKVTAGTFSLNSNNQMVQEECSTQNPTGFVRGLFESIGTLSILPDDAVRWDQYEGANDLPAQMLFESKIFIFGSTPWSIAINMEQWTIEAYARGKADAAQSAEITYRSISNDVNGGPVEVVIVSRKPV